MGLLNIVPLPYRLLAYALLITTFGGLCWVKGASHVQAKWDAEIDRRTALIAKVRLHNEEIKVKILTKYVDRVKTVTLPAQTNTVEVPVYVTVRDDSACTINNGFVMLLDAAAGNSALPASGDSHAPALGIDAPSQAQPVP